MNLDISKDYSISRTMSDPEVQRNAYIELISSRQNRYHLTIKYPHNTSHRKCRERLSQLIRYMNRDIYKSRYTEGLNFIDGFACEEFCIKENTHHYHIVIRDCEYLPEHNKFNEIIAKKVRAIAEYDPKNQVKDPYLQDYYNLGNNKLEVYVTKDVADAYFKGNSFDSTIGILGAGDVVF